MRLRCAAVASQREFTGFVQYQGTGIDLGSPFRRASMADLVAEACNLHFAARGFPSLADLLGPWKLILRQYRASVVDSEPQPSSACSFNDYAGCVPSMLRLWLARRAAWTSAPSAAM